MLLHWKHSKFCCDCRNPKCELNFAVSSVWNLLLKLEEGAEIQKHGRKFSWVSDFSVRLWHTSSKVLQKYWVVFSSTNFTWSQMSALMKTYKCVSFHSLNVSIPSRRIFFIFVLVVFLTLCTWLSPWICI